MPETPEGVEPDSLEEEPPKTAPTVLTDNALNRVWQTLNREVAISSLDELRNGLDATRRPHLATEIPIAFGFDTNAVFRVGLGPRGADALDYLNKIQNAPVIIPGQVVQEVWNNLLSAVEPQAKTLRKKFDALSLEMGNIDQRLGAAGQAARDAIAELIKVNGDWIDPTSQSAFDSTLDALLPVSVTSYVPRNDFAGLAQIRRDTKTPPGFQDSGFGDFYVWADFLYGLASADPSRFEAAVFVTNDVKLDWSRNGVAHPILIAEAEAVAGVPFRLWTLDEFHRFIKSFSS